MQIDIPAITEEGIVSGEIRGVRTRLACPAIETPPDATRCIAGMIRYVSSGIAMRDGCCGSSGERRESAWFQSVYRVRDQLFIRDRIFPESELPLPSEILEASERLFELLFVRNEPDHYMRTCQAWLDRLGAAAEDATALVGEEVVADYHRYLEACIHGFAKRHTGLVRVVFERIS